MEKSIDNEPREALMTDDEWAEQAVHNLLMRCWARACEVLAWLDELE